MQIDWVNAGVELGIAVLTFIGGMYATSGRHEERFITVFNRLESQDAKHLQHEAEFKKLPEHYVPRTEIDARLKNIEENSVEIKRLVNYLVLYRGRPPVALPNTPDLPPGA